MYWNPSVFKGCEFPRELDNGMEVAQQQENRQRQYTVTVGMYGKRAPKGVIPETMYDRWIRLIQRMSRLLAEIFSIWYAPDWELI